VAEHDRSTAPLLDVSVHLFLHFLSLEFNISPVEMFGVNPRHRFAVDVDMVEEQQVGRADRAPQSLRLFLDHLGLTAQANTFGLKPISEDVFKQIRL